MSADHVIIASGCSGALELALTALLDPGSVLLVPKPGFPLYSVIAESHGATVVHYNLRPDHGWECDMQHLQDIMNDYPPGVVRAMVVNNPSNPTGSVYSESHLHEIVSFSQGNRLPIVADEIYGELTFGNNKFLSIAQVAKQKGNRVPVIVASGIAKQFLLPGWRVGWIVFYDK